MNTALLLISTGEKYHQYIRPLLASAREFFIEHTPVLWTDSKEKYDAVTISLEAQGFPNASLLRYHNFYAKAGSLINFTHLFYCDIDMLFVSPIEEEEVESDGITATLHPGFFINRNDGSGFPVTTRGTPEWRHKESKAYMHHRLDNKYFCGGFNGGTAESFLKMSDTIRQNIIADKALLGPDFTPVWNDESYLNRYLFDNPPAKILTPSFCWPENYDNGYGWSGADYPPKLVALNKAARK